MSDGTPVLVYSVADLPPELADWICECRSGCWEWQRARNPAGYGQVVHEGRTTYVHRLVYQELGRVIPVGYVIDHLCRNPPCCNPAHLEAVTRRENLDRAVLAQRNGLSDPVPETLSTRASRAEWAARLAGATPGLVAALGSRVALSVREIPATGCWEWTGFRNPQGYGRTKVGTTATLVHRLAFERKFGPIGEGLTLDHLCHNADPDCEGGAICQHRRCCNPAHLEPVTRSVNTARSARTTASLNAAKQKCPAGHPYEGANLQRTARGRACKTCNGWKGSPSPSERTHCPRLHAYTAENTYLNKRGQRSCKECRRIVSREYQRRRRAAARAALVAAA